MELLNANPIGLRPVSSTVTPPQTPNLGPANPILAPNLSGEPRGHWELGTSFHSTDSEVLVVVDDPSVAVSSDSVTISQLYESFIDDNGDHCYRVAQQRDVVQGRKDGVEVELATSLHDNIVQVVESRPPASDSVDLIPARRVPPPADVMGTLSAPGNASPIDREVLSAQAVASYVFSGGARNYLTANDVNNDDDVQLTLNSALEFLASGENVVINDGVNAMTVDRAACEIVSSAAYEAVPVTTACDTVSVGICTSNLARGMDGAGIRPSDRVSANVVRSTASSTAHTAVQPLNIFHYDGAMDEAMDDRNMRYTAMNEPAIRPTGVANIAMAEINRFSRNNNECMQYDGDVCVREVHRDTVDLTDLFCSMQTRRAQQTQRSPLYTLTDEDYPTAGQRQPDTSPQSTQHTQASTSQPLQPTQHADMFQQEFLAMADAAMQQRSASPAPAPTGVQSTVLLRMPRT